MAGRNLSREIYETFTARINQWIYPPGYRLTEEAISAEFQVSRSPVRDALNMLAQANLIHKEDRKGYAVRHIDLREINELYDTRLILELAVVENICDTGMDAGILAGLKMRWQEILTALPDMAAEAALEDEQFHETLADAGGNKVIARLLKEIDSQIHFVRVADITDPERLKKTCLDHLDLLEAIGNCDKPRAAGIVRQNIEWGRDKVAAAIQEALARAHGII